MTYSHFVHILYHNLTVIGMVHIILAVSAILTLVASSNKAFMTWIL